MSEANLNGAFLTAALYSYCADSPAEFDLKKAGAILVGEGADLSGMDLSNVRLYGCQLSEVNFSHLELLRMLSFLALAWTCPGGHNSLRLHASGRPEFVNAQPPARESQQKPN